MKGSASSLSIVIAAGGTGGHLYPAVALAKEFARQVPATRVLFLGSTRGIEAKVLGHEGFEFQSVTAFPVMGLGRSAAVRAALAFPKGLWQAVGILRSARANLVIGIGGYTTPAVIVAAFLSRVHRVILEPNAQAGMANKALGPLAELVFLAFDSAASAFAGSKVRVVGTPVRREFCEAQTGAFRGKGEDKPVLLIFGGSQGARAVNHAVMDALPHLTNLRGRVEIVHQTGESDCERVQHTYKEAGVPATVVPFLFDMPARLRAATLVVARSGAMTVAELTACGKPAILIPLPHAIHDHQMRNARVLEAAGAAAVIPQAELDGARLARTIMDLLSAPHHLQAMSDQSRALGRTGSAEEIVRECLKLVGQA